MSGRSFRSLRRRCTRCGRRRYCEPYSPVEWLCGGCGVPSDARRHAGRRTIIERRRLRVSAIEERRAEGDRRYANDRRSLKRGS
jgi:hypothetical protein